MNVAKMPPNIGEVSHWDEWNTKFRQWGQFDDEPTMRRMREVLMAVRALQKSDARILEVGCATGWLTAKLVEFGTVMGVDLGADSIRYAAAKLPSVEFKAGDILELDLPINHFDIVVTLETLSHIADKDRFMQKMAQSMKTGGTMILTTQNKFVFDRCDVAPNIGWTREWVNMARLKRLVRSRFTITRATSFDPKGHRGILRLINSSKVNRLLARIVGESRLKRMKESAGFGQTLFLIAVKR